MDRLPSRDAFKTPAEVLDYTFEWADWLAGGSLETSTWSVDTGLTQVSESDDGQNATLWLSGGTVPLKYRAVNQVTSGGRTAQRTLNIHLVPHR